MKILNKICKGKIDETVEKIVEIFDATKTIVLVTWPAHILNLSVLHQ